MNTQFWKGLMMALVGIIVTAFSTMPISWPVVIVTLIGTTLVYFGTNKIIPLQPISLPSTLTFRDVVHGLLIAIGTGILNSIALIIIDERIVWVTLGKITLSIFFTYLGSTLFGGPYSTKKINWSYQARLEYNNRVA